MVSSSFMTFSFFRLPGFLDASKMQIGIGYANPVVNRDRRNLETENWEHTSPVQYEITIYVYQRHLDCLYFQMHELVEDVRESSFELKSIGVPFRPSSSRGCIFK